MIILFNKWGGVGWGGVGWEGATRPVAIPKYPSQHNMIGSRLKINWGRL